MLRQIPVYRILENLVFRSSEQLRAPVHSRISPKVDPMMEIHFSNFPAIVWVVIVVCCLLKSEILLENHQITRK